MVRHLYKIFREKDRAEFDNFFKERLSYESLVKFPFKIKPMDQPEHFSLYYIPTQHITELIVKIYKQDNQLLKLSRALPDIAKHNLIMELLVDELHNTNDLEGVRSTKEEIIRSAREVSLDKKSDLRFSSMVATYFNLLSNEKIIINEPKDVRRIYDDITKDEIEKQEIPDGKLFRVDATYVYKKSGSGKIIHRGITPEDKIIESIEQLINFMNDGDFTALIKIAVGHYYFGYIHPFYDGNGRTSRFISSLYLNNECSELTALSLSRGCNNFRNQYLKSFEITNSFANKGEMNNFIENFLTIISETQEEMILQVKEKINLFDDLWERLNSDERLDERCRKVMFILAQNYYFALDEKGLTVRELAEIIEKSPQFIRSVLKELDSFDVISQRGERPIIYSISEKYFD